MVKGALYAAIGFAAISSIARSLLSSADVATPIWVIPVANGGDRIKEEPAK